MVEKVVNVDIVERYNLLLRFLNCVLRKVGVLFFKILVMFIRKEFFVNKKSDCYLSKIFCKG